jgi:hypothetical protein
MFEVTTLTNYSDESLLAEMRRVADCFKGERLTKAEFDKLSKVHSATLVRRFGSWNEALDRAQINSNVAPRTRRVDRESVIDEIKEFAKRSGSPPTIEDIAQRLGTHQVTIRRNFGKWHQLLDEAGLRPVPQGRRYTDEKCFENIVDLWTHYGRQPRLHELTCSPSNVSSSAYLHRWGTWRTALGAFLEYINKAPTGGVDQGLLEPQTDSSPSISANSPSSKRPRTLNLALRYRVLVRDRFRCQICGRSPAKDLGVELHVDHVVPWSKGGENIDDNLRALCSDCNLGKGAKFEMA